MTKLKYKIGRNVFSDFEAIQKQVLVWKRELFTLVFTNGCFDILHRGHLDYLEKTSQLADKLIVGLNSDQSVRNLKGEERPINNQQDRAMMLASLSFVDAVVLFEEETPIKLIKGIMPQVLAKGGDYDIHTIVGAKEVLENGGKVEIIDFVFHQSTTEILSKIKSL